MADDLCHVVFCLRRRQDLSPSAFAAYWRDVHGPLVAERAHLVGIRRYVQKRATGPEVAAQLAASRHAPEGFDGVAELWVERAALTAPLAPQARQAAKELLEDERRFIDLAASPIFIVEAHEIPLPATAATDGRS